MQWFGNFFLISGFPKSDLLKFFIQYDMPFDFDNFSRVCKIALRTGKTGFPTAILHTLPLLFFSTDLSICQKNSTEFIFFEDIFLYVLICKKK